MSAAPHAQALAAENVALRNRVEDLQFEVAELRGTSSRAMERAARLKAHYRISPRLCRFLDFMRDGRIHAREAIERGMMVSDEAESLHNASVAVCHFRKLKPNIQIKTIWGFGYQLEADTAAEVRRIAEGEGQ